MQDSVMCSNPLSGVKPSPYCNW